MEKEKNSILNDLIPQLKTFVKSETVFGEPYTIGTVTLIPVNSVRMGFGFGEGENLKKSDKAVGGGGVLLTPVAFIIIKDGEVSIHNLTTGTIESVMEKIPELLDKFAAVLSKHQNQGKTGSEKTAAKPDLK